MQTMNPRGGLATFFRRVTLAGMIVAVSSNVWASGIIASIDKATVVADGNVSGRPVDIVITLDGSLDQNVPGRSLAAGNKIRVIFPAEFDLASISPAFPVLNVPTPGQCTPNNLQCTTAVILHGWPEQPFFPPAAFHTVSVDTVDNAFVFTATQDLVPNPPTNPGIKQLFLMLHGVTNPSPGHYRIQVEAQTGPGGDWETGSAMLQVIPQSRPSVNVTSVLVKALSGLPIPNTSTPACGPGTLPPNPDNPVSQTTGVGSFAPLTWTFLVWGKDNVPLNDVQLRWVNQDHAQIRSAGQTVGHVYIDAPHDATNYGIVQNPRNCPTLMGGAPVIGPTPGIGPQPVGRLDLLFQAGSEPGDYTTTISLNNGNSVQMVVTAE